MTSIQNQTLLQFFQSPPIGAIFTSEEMEALRPLNVAAKHYPPHTVISHQGDVEQRLFIINSGWACSYRDLNNGDRQIIDFPLKGDVVGVVASPGPSTDSLASTTELSIFEMSRTAVGKAFGRSSWLAQFILSAVARQSSIVIEHLTNAGRRNALVRTAHLLLEMDARLSTFGESTQQGFDCPLTQQELADALGLTAIHVNRTLRDLREHNLVSFRSGFVEFLDKPRLINMIGFDKEFLGFRVFSSSP
jgi:CRP-like cAMP-binding protein